MKLHRKKKIELAVNLTPLIDCVFLLLIFFLLTSWLTEPRAIEIELPQSAYAEKINEKNLIITLTKQGKIFLGEKQVRLNELCSALRSQLIEQKSSRAVLRADKETSLGLLFQVMDEIKKAGISAVDIQAISKSQKSGSQ